MVEALTSFRGLLRRRLGRCDAVCAWDVRQARCLPRRFQAVAGCSLPALHFAASAVISPHDRFHSRPHSATPRCFGCIPPAPLLRHALAAQGVVAGPRAHVHPPPPAAAGAEVQPARHAQRRQGVPGPEERPPPRLLQRAKGGHPRAPQVGRARAMRGLRAARPAQVGGSRTDAAWCACPSPPPAALAALACTRSTCCASSRAS